MCEVHSGPLLYLCSFCIFVFVKPLYILQFAYRKTSTVAIRLVRFNTVLKSRVNVSRRICKESDVRV
jgi:hypothetical protein